MAKKENNNNKLDVRVVFDYPLSQEIRERATSETRKPCQLIRHIIKEYFQQIGE